MVGVAAMVGAGAGAGTEEGVRAPPGGVNKLPCRAACGVAYKCARATLSKY